MYLPQTDCVEEIKTCSNSFHVLQYFRFRDNTFPSSVLLNSSLCQLLGWADQNARRYVAKEDFLVGARAGRTFHGG